MNVTGATSPAPVDSSPSNVQKPATGFWALFFDPQHPEAAPNSNAPVTGPVGFEALFGNATVTPPPNSAATTVNTSDAASQLVAQYGQAAEQQIP
jgi:hypothetical protein